ncbi:hypothetical protein WUBG_00452 [Wuchereria bancrofti]|uniref:Chromo domain-containing protein n=1 Tax=Wuchereria bancrofti TaxID=6293 RepID=J9FMP6_WUCBA|nr:hypothetical protein WUBG_00452 [Wuchereria bancrofti]VDM08714.1 unnamed protein product [Wuchereria bancrofti]
MEKEVNEEPKEEANSKTEGEADNDSDDCIIVYENIVRGKKRRHGDTIIPNSHQVDQLVKSSADKGSKVQKKNLQENEAYFNQSFGPERIVRAISATGKMKFLMKWKSASKSNWVSEEIANERCSKIIFNFYDAQLLKSNQ